eukprot:5491913-Pyramimonas_sp.AAC.1
MPHARVNTALHSARVVACLVRGRLQALSRPFPGPACSSSCAACLRRRASRSEGRSTSAHRTLLAIQPSATRPRRNRSA